MQLKPFIEDPRPVLRLLEKLKTDSVLMVRRSVANNLNDIAKDNPDTVVKTLVRWMKIENEGTKWLIRQAAGTLVKQGNKDALAVLGYSSTVEVKVTNLQAHEPGVKMGHDLKFSFEVRSISRQEQDLVIDYVIHHAKANGRLAPKVFKLAQRKMRPGEAVLLTKRHSFRPISIRKYYPGKHVLEIQVNGERYGKLEFELA